MTLGLLTVAILMMAAMQTRATEIHVTFDAAGTQTTGTVPLATPFTFYVVADQFPDSSGINGVEFGLSYGASMFILSSVFAGTPVVLGTPPSYIVGFGGAQTGDPVLLATFTALILAPVSDFLVSIGASTPSSVAGTAPAYLDGANNLLSFNWTSDLLLNPTGTVAAPVLHDPGQQEGPSVPEPGTLALLALGVAGMRRASRTLPRVTPAV